MPDKQYMTPNQMAAMLGIRKDKPLQWIHSGELQAINLAEDGNGQRPRWRISIEEIERFLAARASKPADPEPPKPRRRRKTTTRQWV